MPHLALDASEALADQLVELLRSPFGDVTEMRDDGVTAQRLDELHRVLDRRDRLLAPLLILDCEHCEVRSVDRHGDATIGSHLTESPTSALVPWEPVDERKLQRAMACLHEAIQPLGLVHVFRRHPGNAESDHRRKAIGSQPGA